MEADKIEAFFNAHYQLFKDLVRKRKSRWRATSVMAFEDVESIILTRIYRQLPKYDEGLPLDRWTNKLISNAMMSLLRDHLYRDSPPCTSGRAPGFSSKSSYGRGCVYYQGEGQCRWTKSGVCDASCRFYAAWLKKKQVKHAVNSTSSIETHVVECSNKPGSVVTDDQITRMRQLIADHIQQRLTKEEYRIYVFLHVKNLTRKDTAVKLGFKANDQKGYLKVRSAHLRIEEVVKEILAENAL